MAPLVAGVIADRVGALIAAVGLVGTIAVADLWTGFEVRLAVLYLLPVFLATWAIGRMAGTVIALLSTVTWLVSFGSSHPYTEAIYFYWDGAILLGTLVAFALILARLRRALDSADQRFVTVLEGLDAAIYVGDIGSGAMLYANRRFRDYFPDNAEAIDADRFESGLDVSPANYFASAKVAHNDQAPLRGEFRDRVSERCFLVHARAVNWVDGRRVSLKVVADITEAKRAESASRQQMEKLQMSAKLITIGEMASGLAHELNQPLTAIASYNQACVRMLAAGDADPGELRAYMEKCGIQAVRAGSIINRMREYVRKREPLRSANDINAIVSEARGMIEVDAAKKGVELRLHLTDGLPLVLADAIMIEQVLLNLMRNGIEAMQQVGERRRALDVSSKLGSGDMVQVTVRDVGHGVGSEDTANLFTPFFSTKADGMGIGLSISRSIIELHGGKIWHEPAADGDGSVFCFTVPKLAE